MDQYGRPAPPHHSYSALPASGHANSHFAAPTPPPPPNSAPPGSVYHLQSQPSQWSGQPPPPRQQSPLPPAPPMLNTAMSPGRPTSAADIVSPNRPLSSTSYHALPLPPAPAASYHQQQQHELQGVYQTIASPAEYAGSQQPSPAPATAVHCSCVFAFVFVCSSSSIIKSLSSSCSDAITLCRTAANNALGHTSRRCSSTQQ
jgi:hypothetical protein